MGMYSSTMEQWSLLWNAQYTWELMNILLHLYESGRFGLLWTTASILSMTAGVSSGMTSIAFMFSWIYIEENSSLIDYEKREQDGMHYGLYHFQILDTLSSSFLFLHLQKKKKKKRRAIYAFSIKLLLHKSNHRLNREMKFVTLYQ